VRNDQNGNTTWTWQNGFVEIGSYNPAGAPYLTYSDAEVLADGSAETASVVIANNGVGALSVLALNHAAAETGICGDGTLDVGEQCDDSNTSPGDCCSSTCQFESSATICRASIGVCDVAETCDGAGTCSPNGFEPPSTLCRASAGTCDLAENCSGASASCPADVFHSAATQCRSSAGACDIAENCPGSGADCPSDTFESAGVECRPAVGLCDVAETCSGTGIECASDVVLDGIPCLDGDVCNGAEQCVAGVCEAPPGLDCDDNNVCTADACDAITGCSHAIIPDCVAAVPSMPWTGRTLLVLFMILASAATLTLRQGRQGA
jgi:cysteine-rich repeat protein